MGKPLERSLPRPSFRRFLEAERRTSARWHEVFPERGRSRPDHADDPRHALIHKLRGKALAQATGIAMPAVYRIWDGPGSIDLAGLPGRFVVKSAGGASSQGVLPLVREGDAFRVISTDKVLTEPEIVEYFRHKRELKKARPPYFAEEFLVGVHGNEILEDVKIYAFYGEIGQVLLRSVGSHGDPGSVRYRYLDEEGADLGAVSRQHAVDPAIPVPRCLPEMVKRARELSVAAGIPFLRVDLYETDRGVVFGEFTPRPGGDQEYVWKHDRHLGELWERARLRLDVHISEQLKVVPDVDTARRIILGAGAA
ncbi:ATP-grasp fold amidoligase family protein [Myceligenerans crystallogenes]|uniref:TupA-like ATPgrasp n=1 Tax=Myceligenerans crystallogenes TaxID=316335 RepID=A0ABN2NBU6_9MICO